MVVNKANSLAKLKVAAKLMAKKFLKTYTESRVMV